MNEIKSQSGVPIPAIKKGGRKRKYPLYTMEVDEHFYVSEGEFQSVRSAIHKHRRGDGYHKEYVTRKLEDGTYGIWRVK